MHVDEAVLAPLRERYGEPPRLEWEGEISEREHSLATYNPNRAHDVTLFIFNGERLALIRKHGFEPGIWRPPGGGVKPGEDFVAGVQREALEETGPARSSSSATSSTPRAHFVYEPYDVPWRTHVFSATHRGRRARPAATRTRLRQRAGARCPELSGPLRSGCSRQAARSGATASRCMTRPQRRSRGTDPEGVCPYHHSELSFAV